MGGVTWDENDYVAVEIYYESWPFDIQQHRSLPRSRHPLWEDPGNELEYPAAEAVVLFVNGRYDFWPVIQRVSMKKKENRNAASNPNLSYPYISPAYHYTTTPTRQNSENVKYIN